MKKLLLLIVFTVCGMTMYSQTVFEVGAGKTYQKLTDVWSVIKGDEVNTEFIINVDEGIYVENELLGMPNKKITIIGAGADKTTIMRSNVADFPLIEEYGEDFSSGRVNCGILFKSAINTADNFHLVCENMTFKNIGINRHNWGAALVEATSNNQTYEFRNCMFTKINARQGTLVGATPGGNATTATQPLKIVLEGCFVESCYVHNYNNMAGFFNFKFGGDLTIKNTTFMNNRANLTNLNSTTEYPGAGLIVSMLVPTAANANYTSNITLDNVNILNTDIIGGAETTYVAMVKMDVNASAPAPVVTITDLTSVNNVRSGAVDSDLYFTSATFTPTITSSVFNVVKNVAGNADITPLTGATINPALTYTSPEVNFEMDGELPKIFVNEYGVKYLKKVEEDPGPATSVSNADADVPSVRVVGNSLHISGLQSGETIRVYNIAGSLMKNITVTSNSVYIALSSGMYIVKAGAHTAKVAL